MPLLRIIPETTNVDFVKWRWLAFSVDGLLLVMSVVSILTFGLNKGLDFTGGTQIEFKSAQTSDVAQMRSDVEALGFGIPTVTLVSGGTCDRPVGSCATVRVQPPKNVSSQ